MEFRNKERDIITCIMFSIFSLGIYAIYWIYAMTEEANALSDNEYKCAGGGLVIVYSIITLGIYLWYWSYKMGDRLHLARVKRGVQCSSSNGAIYLVLSIVQLDFIGILFMQNELNKIAILDNANENKLS
jgi:hypothetical protein